MMEYIMFCGLVLYLGYIGAKLAKQNEEILKKLDGKD